MPPKRKAKTQKPKVTKKVKLEEEVKHEENTETKELTDEEVETEISPTNLTRKETFELEPDKELETKNILEKSLSLKRSSLSIKLFGKDEDILETEELSLEAKTKLQKSLSSILQPKFSRNEIIVRTHKVIDEDSREFQRVIQLGNDDIIEEDDDTVRFADIPPEIIVQIFGELCDEDKWQFARVNKVLYAIFKLYVGWDNLLIASDHDLQSASTYCEPPVDHPITTTECHLVIPPHISSDTSYIANKNYLGVDYDVYSLYQNKVNYKKRGTMRINRYDNTHFTLLVFHQTEFPASNYSQEMMKKFAAKRESEKDLPHRKLLAIIPFMKKNANNVAPIFFDPPYIDLLIGDAKLVDKDLNGSAYYSVNYAPYVGKNRENSFVTVQSTVATSNTVNIKMMFDIKKFQKAYARGVRPSDTVKTILLRLLQINSIASAKLIKWNIPSSILMQSVRPASQPSNLNLKLYDYQLRGLAWMMDIEKNFLKRKYTFTKVIKAPGYPVLDFYMDAGPYSGNSTRSLHFNIVTDDQINTEEHPELFDTFTCRGGIMADEMGLGKTVTVLSLILSNPRRTTPDGTLIIEDRKEALFESKSSLIICPNQLIVQWQNEFNNHCEKKLKIITILSVKDLKASTYQKIVDSDVVILSHQFLKNTKYLKPCGALATLQDRAEKNRSKVKITKINPVLQHIGWHRIIIDEGHEFLSSSEGPEGKELFNSFLSNYRWYVTGTPVPRGRDSIVGLLNFLSIKIESSKSNGKEKFIELEDVASVNMIAYELCLFTAVKENLFWKNTKKSVNNQAFIPNFAEQIEFITLSPCEQAIHDAAVSRNDPNDSRLVCTQPMKSMLVKQLKDKGKISDLGEKILANLKEKITFYRMKLPKYKSNLPIIIKEEEITIKEMDEWLTKEPAVKTFVPPNHYYPMETEEYKKWRLEKLKISNLHSKQLDSIQSLKTKIIDAENEIVSLVGQAACFSRLFHNFNNENEENCELCLKTALDREVTSCDHYFCSVCIMDFVRRNSHCPICNTSLQIHNIYQVKKSKDKNKKNKDEKNEKKIEKKKEGGIYLEIREEYGTKISVILKTLIQLLHSDDSSKIIVFSKWDNLLNTLGHLLDNYYQYPDNDDVDSIELSKSSIHVSCKGNVIIKNKLIDHFNSPEKYSPRVLFLSLSSAASGTHLTVASHILLVDSPAGTKEEAIAYDSQAIARSHRIGQEKQVTVIRFIVEHSIDHDDYIKAYG